MPFENPYAPPLAELAPPSTKHTTFFVVAPRKLLLMILLSQGFYFIYWSYKQWASYREASGARIWPVARAFFSVFFFYSLAMKIRQKLELTNSRHRWWPRCLAIALTISAILPQVLGLFVETMSALKLNFCFLIVDAALMVQIQHAVNHLENDPQGKANCRITWANGIWIALGVSLWALGIVSALYLLL